MTASRLHALTKMSLDANWQLLVLVGAHLVITLLLSLSYGFVVDLNLTWNLQFFAGCYVLLACLLLIKRLLARPANPARDLLREWRSWKLDERFALAAPALLAISLFACSFTALKSAIPLMNPYSWDPTFAAWDRALFGTDVWRLIHPVVGRPPVTVGLNLMYQAWLPVFNCAVAVACLQGPESALRRRFLLSFVLCWALVGNLAATLLASVGPCFAAPLLGDHSYEGLMSYLRDVAGAYPLPALEVQDMLLRNESAGASGLGAGISAMPSMHVSIATLLALAGARLSRGWGAAGAAFVAVTMLATTHLGFHYAVDGLVAMALTAAIWALTGRLIASRWSPAPVLDRAAGLQLRARRGAASLADSENQ